VTTKHVDEETQYIMHVLSQLGRHVRFGIVEPLELNEEQLEWIHQQRSSAKTESTPDEKILELAQALGHLSDD